MYSAEKSKATAYKTQQKIEAEIREILQIRET